MRVRDDGPGVPASARTLIFQPFFSTKPAEAGTGLGLSTVRGLVESVGGIVELSEPAPEAGDRPRAEFVVWTTCSSSTTGAKRSPCSRPCDEGPGSSCSTVRCRAWVETKPWRIRELAPATRFLIVTGQGQGGAHDASDDSRAVGDARIGLLEKPFTRSALEQALDAVLGAAVPPAPTPPTRATTPASPH